MSVCTGDLDTCAVCGGSGAIESEVTRFQDPGPMMVTCPECEGSGRNPYMPPLDHDTNVSRPREDTDVQGSHD